MGRVLLLLLLIHLGLAFAAIVDCLGGESKPERLSRLTWAGIALFGLLIGPVTWFTYGRPGRRVALPWSDTDQGRPLAPDDDPDFLADLARRAKPTWRRPEPEPDQPSDSPRADSDAEDTDTAPDERNNGTT